MAEKRRRLEEAGEAAMAEISAQYAEHIASLRGFMRSQGVECLVVTKAPLFFWCTGGRCYVPTIEEAGPAKLFVDQNQAVVITTAIEEHRMKNQECPGFEVRAAAWAGLPGTMDKIQEELIAGRKVELDTGDLQGELDELSADLTDLDQAAYRELGKDIGAALEEAARSVQVGDSEYEVSGKTHAAYSKYKIDLIMIAVAHDERISWDRHPLPRLGDDTSLRKICLIATCGRRKGLVASLSRLVCFGEVPEQQRKIHQACMEVDAELNLGTIPGRTAGECYNLAAEAYKSRGYGEAILEHHQGGLIGYKCRHWIAQPEGTQVIKAGRAYAWNPTIAIPGFGTKSEDTIIVNRDGSQEVITTSPDWPMVEVTTADGKKMMRPDILVK